MKEQEKKTGWCFFEKTETEFTSTIPKGRWVCGNCRFTTSELLKKPLAQIKDTNKYYI